MIEVIKKIFSKKVGVLQELHSGKALHFCNYLITERFENGEKFKNHSSFSNFTYLRIGCFQIFKPLTKSVGRSDS